MHNRQIEEVSRYLAIPARFERATFRLGGGRSILLSYGTMELKQNQAPQSIIPYRGPKFKVLILPVKNHMPSRR